MPMFHIKLTRLIEQECTVWARGADADAACDKALEDIPPSTIWTDSDCEPHTYGAECIEEHPANGVRVEVRQPDTPETGSVREKSVHFIGLDRP
jgi:hypothetical protein